MLKHCLMHLTSSQVNLNHVVKTDNVSRYLQNLRTLNIGPSGQATKLQTVMAAIDFVLSRLPDSGATEEEREVAHSATITRSKVQKWKKGISKEKAVQAMKKKEFVSENLQSPAEVHTFLNSEIVREKMESLSDEEEDSLTLRR